MTAEHRDASAGTVRDTARAAADSAREAAPLRRVAEAAQEATAAYSPDEPRPLGGYVATMGTFGVAVTAIGAAAAASGHRFPERTSWSDVALITLATHKLTRIITKDSIASPLRAPFTRYKGVSGPGELAEEVREHGGIRHSVGELLTCPFCLAVWVGTGFTIGLAVAPRTTRAAATTMTAVFGSDVLQFLYARLEQSE